MSAPLHRPQLPTCTWEFSLVGCSLHLPTSTPPPSSRWEVPVSFFQKGFRPRWWALWKALSLSLPQGELWSSSGKELVDKASTSKHICRTRTCVSQSASRQTERGDRARGLCLCRLWCMAHGGGLTKICSVVSVALNLHWHNFWFKKFTPCAGGLCERWFFFPPNSNWKDLDYRFALCFCAV